MATLLPVEVLFHIFSYLPSAADLCRCSIVCRRWRAALDEMDGSPVWKQALKRKKQPFIKSYLIQELQEAKAKLVALENAWNGDDCSKTIYLLTNDLTFHRKPKAERTDAIRGKRGYRRGLHYWTVDWHRPSYGSNAVIGVSTAKESLTRTGYCSLLGSSYESWGWNISARVLMHRGKELVGYPASYVEIKIGQRFGVTLDMNRHTLSFDLNGYPLGVAFRGLPFCKLFPAVSAVYGKTEVTLIYHGYTGP